MTIRAPARDGDRPSKKAKLDGDYDDGWARKLPTGVQQRNGRFSARIRNPKSKARVWLGSYGTVEEACAAIHDKSEEFQKHFGFKKPFVDEIVESYGDAEAKLPSGVQQRNGRFSARIMNPKSKARVWLGSYGTVEEACAAIHDKSEEYQKQFGSKKPFVDENVESYGDAEAKLPSGVQRRNDRFRAQIRNPKSKARVWVGSFASLEEACAAIQDKREKFGIVDKNVERFKEAEVVAEADLPSGVRMTKSGKCGAWVKNPMSGMECWFRSYNTMNEAAIAAQRKQAELDKLFESQDKNGGVVDEDPKSGSHHVSSPTSVFEAETLSDPITNAYQGEEDNASLETQSDPIFCTPKFDEWVRLGIMNEYGELIGQYCKIDDDLWITSR